ncbi:GNAT family N-acetyltransferase [bacterium]|nr:GNAT family N-acetyltransferase [candidate division CSSED10-310 bacterium]
MRKGVCCLLLIILAGCGSSRIVPEDFELPVGFETPEFRVRPITIADAEKDYEAVMESIDIIHAALLSDKWPTESFSVEDNRRDLAEKERRFKKKTSFTYTVVSLDESRVLGSVYINKGMRGPDAAVFMWVRKSSHKAGLDPALEGAIREWMDREWPFKWVVYPGRTAVQSDGA